MIDLDLQGRVKNKKKFTQYAEECMHWLIPNIRRDVYVNVRFVTKCEHDYLGLCWGDKDVAEIEVSRTYENKPLTTDDIARTLAHELVHAKQYIKKQLHPNLKWKNQTYEGYRRTPWEKEAYTLEDELFDLFWR
jgi:hypothetical protein